MFKNRSIILSIGCVSSLILGIYGIFSLFISLFSNPITDMKTENVFIATILFILTKVISRLNIISCIFSTLGFINKNYEHIIISLIIQLFSIIFYFYIIIDFMLLVNVFVFVLILIGYLIEIFKNKKLL